MPKLQKGLVVVLIGYVVSGAIVALWLMLRPNALVWRVFEASLAIANACALVWLLASARPSKKFQVELALMAFVTILVIVLFRGSKKLILPVYTIVSMGCLSAVGAFFLKARRSAATNQEESLQIISGPFCWLASIAALLFCSGFLLLIVVNANWVLGDDKGLLETILSGKFWPVKMTWVVGRFNPLFWLDYDLFLYVGNQPFWFYVWAAAKATIAGLFVYLAARNVIRDDLRLRKADRLRTQSVAPALAFVFLVLFFLGKKIYMMFAEVIFAEQTLVPLIAVFVFFYLSFMRTGKATSAVCSIVAGSLACYLKEPVFVILATVAAVGLLQWKKQTAIQRRFNIFLILSSALFVALYIGLVFGKTQTPYYQGRAMGRDYLALTWEIVTEQPVLWVGLVVFALRLRDIIKEKSLMPYDALLLASFAFVGVFIALGLSTDYYFVPTYVLILPCVLHFVVSYSFEDGIVKKLSAALSTVVLIASYAGSGDFLLSEMGSIQSARKTDLVFIRSLRGKDIYYVTKKEIDPNKSFANELDSWAYDTIQTFLEFDVNGKVMGNKKITRVDDARELDSRNMNTVVLVPRRVRGNVVLPGSLHLTQTHWVLDCYTP